MLDLADKKKKLLELAKMLSADAQGAKVLSD